MTDLNEVTAVE